MLDIDSFVNGNAHNVTLVYTSKQHSDDAECERLHTEFESKFEYDETNDDASPVFVYLRDGNAIAWYDWENMYGYIAQ